MWHFFTDVEIGFVKTFYDLTQDESLKPLLIAIRMIQGILETNVSLTVHLTLRSSTEGKLVLNGCL